LLMRFVSAFVSYVACNVATRST